MLKLKLYKFNGVRWHWCQLGELASALGMPPSEVIRRYSYCNKDRERGFVAICDGAKLHNVEIQDLIEACLHFESESNLETAGAIYLPSGLVEDIVQAHWAEQLFELLRGKN